MERTISRSARKRAICAEEARKHAAIKQQEELRQAEKARFMASDIRLAKSNFLKFYTDLQDKVVEHIRKEAVDCGYEGIVDDTVFRGVTDQILWRSVEGKKKSIIRDFCSNIMLSTGDNIKGFVPKDEIVDQMVDSDAYWNWEMLKEFLTILIKARWVEIDAEGGLAQLPLLRLMTSRNGKAQVRELFYQLYEQKIRKEHFKAPMVSVRYVVSDEKAAVKDDAGTEYLVTKAIRHAWKRTAKGLFMAWGEGFKAQQNQRIFLDPELLDEDLRAYLVEHRAEQYVSDDDDGPANSNVSFNNMLEATGLRKEMLNHELDLACSEGIPVGQSSLCGRERCYHSYEFVFTFEGDKVWRACMVYKKGWKRTKGLIYGVKIKLARELFSKDQDGNALPLETALKRLAAKIKEWEANPPERPQPPTIVDKVTGKKRFDTSSSAYRSFAEELWLWRVIIALLDKNSKVWTVPIEWDAHSSFAGLYGALCHWTEYLRRTNCVFSGDPAKNAFENFYAMSNIIKHMKENGVIKAGSQEEQWAKAYAKAVSKTLQIPAHYAAKYEANYDEAPTVNHPILKILEKDKGKNFPKDILDQMFEGGFNPNAEETLKLTALGRFLMRMFQELTEELRGNPVMGMIRAIKSICSDLECVNAELSLGDGHGSIFMQTHKPVYRRDQRTGENLPMTCNRPAEYDDVFYTVKRGSELSFMLDKSSDRLYRRNARRDTYWLQTTRVGTWLPTGLIHHLDAVFADFISLKLIKKYGFCLSIHDAFVTSPEAYRMLNDEYSNFLEYVWYHGKDMLCAMLTSLGLDPTYVLKACPDLFANIPFPYGPCHTFK